MYYKEIQNESGSGVDASGKKIDRSGRTDEGKKPLCEA